MMELSKLIQNICKICGCSFMAITNKKTLCSAKCKYQLLKNNKINKGLSVRNKIHKHICLQCSKEFTSSSKSVKFCTHRCFYDTRKKYLDIPSCLENPERKIDKNIGYVRIYVPMHPEANTRGYVYEHRVIAEKMIGRRLLPNEIVHHKNHIRWDNGEENLQVMTKEEHSKLHANEVKGYT